jgi:hypothetical protein
MELAVTVTVPRNCITHIRNHLLVLSGLLCQFVPDTELWTSKRMNTPSELMRSVTEARGKATQVS